MTSLENNSENSSENNPENRLNPPSQPEMNEESLPLYSEDTKENAPKEDSYLEPKAEKNKKGWFATGFAVLMAFLGKFKFLVIFLKLGKILTTSSTMLLSVWAYTLLYPLPFAIGFVLLIFIHEMGHLLVLTRYGIKASAPVFIPFMGAMIAMKDMPKNVEME
ncbi:MAG: hypothetical protein K2X66_05355, partial [Cyanobacteria bacterium]|nr:hypothetical protein [Cyanobacteriota bacterium]